MTLGTGADVERPAGRSFDDDERGRRTLLTGAGGAAVLHP
jgi:hypothetical protein